MDVSSKRPRKVAIPLEQVVEVLAGTALFQSCDPQLIERIAPHVYPAETPAGTVIVRAGTPNPGLGIVLSGRVSVQSDGTPAEEVEAGGTFGEVGAFLGTTQTHDVTAESDCVVLLLGQELVAQIASKVPAFAYAAARRMAARATLPPPTPAVPAPVPVRGTTTGPVPAALRGTQTGPSPLRGMTTGPLASEVRFVSVSSYEPILPQVLAMVPAQVIQQHRLLPLELRDRTLTVGMVDPLNGRSRTELGRVLPTVEVGVVAISQDDFNEAYVRLRIDAARPRAGRTPADGVRPETLVFDVADQERDVKQQIIGDEVVQLVSRIVAQAIERGASDVHVETDASGPRIRFRVQGTLQDWDSSVPAAFTKGIIARLKVLAGLDLTERRLPQDGRIGVRVGRREVDMRVSTIPASRGEKVALRIFEAASTLRPLDTIFLDPKVLEAMHAAIQRPYGAIVVAGPTGSGKTTSLYASVNERKRTRPDTNILTVEDPIEYRLSGVTQIQVNHAVELSFAKVLRAMLRQDPDAIMVGEVRDEETAQLALEAAMTGHLLFTSIHANNAVGAIQRLENLGCGRALIGQALALVLVQRLARRLCPRCTTVEMPPPILIESLATQGLVDAAAPQPLPRGAGCAECNQTGHSGRVAVVELLALDDALRAQVMAGASLADIQRTALERGALIPFRQSAVRLMGQKLLNPSEALLTLS